MICGSAELYDPLVRYYVGLTGVPFMSVDYRLSPEFPGTTLAEDTFAGIAWLFDHAAEMGVDPGRIAIMGDSGGGGVAAAAAILARDRGLRLAKQVLIYPMLDDRNTEPDPHLAATAVWTYDNNYTGWKALLGDGLGQSSVSPASAPARLTDFASLAPAYIEVGEMDIFRDESVGYASKLWGVGVSCELHVHPGSPHAHDYMNFGAAVTTRCIADRTRVITAI